MEVITTSRTRKNIQATGHLLRKILSEHPGCREQWQIYTERTTDALNQAAVAKVIEKYLWNKQSLPGDKDARAFKDLVSRAVSGTTLSTSTLLLFIRAFNLAQTDQDRLWALYTYARDPECEITHTLRLRRETLRKQRHRTVNLVERYTVNSAGQLMTRHTTHTIRATEDGVDVYLFNHEPQATKVEVVYGGRTGRSHEYGGGLRSIEIELDHPLSNGESTSLDYYTLFDETGVQINEVRRTAFARVENIDMAVEFTGSPPDAAWWCVWTDQLEGTTVEERVVDVARGSIRQFTSSIEETVVGFRWTR
ncbi:hypothetical protein [Amycolatopsis sp. NPDC003676]